MRFSALLVCASFGWGCAHRGMRMPGPTRSIGDAPPSYADTIDPPTASAPTGAVASEAPETAPPPARRRRGDRRGEAVAQAAAELIGERRLTANGERYRYDCSGMVAAAYARAGTDLSGSSRDLYDKSRAAGVLHKRKLPSPGDVAFFDNTYDRNQNRRRDDALTHVAVVESVDRDGTIVMVHKGSRGVVRITMNLKRPHDRADEQGRELNDYLRASSDKDHGPVLTGELWRAFGSLWAADEDAVADSR
jgi:hypothetical protein